ncbi:MAG TPA: hypothetical protein VF596_14930 [Pyrinomonadaceae bacterium]|jgi:hypothetical protein
MLAKIILASISVFSYGSVEIFSYYYSDISARQRCSVFLMCGKIKNCDIQT